MLPVVDTKTMRACDAQTIRSGISGKELMWRAAKGIFEAHKWQGPVAIVCGSGNNAGDGYALALLLKEARVSCTLFLLGDAFSEDGLYYYEKCKEKRIKTQRFQEKNDLCGYAEIVDCIFGTGFRSVAEGIAAEAIDAINQSGAFVVCADINSGLNGDSGQASLCVRSDLTVSIGFYKHGHFLQDAKDMIGRLTQVDIGIGQFGQRCAHLAEAHDFGGILAKRRQNSHKGAYGYVSVMGGCREFSGAVKLANLSCAALRAGCGVAQLMIPSSLFAGVSPYLLESTLCLLPETEDGHCKFAPQRLDAALSNQKALAVGMGWGRSKEHAKILAHILENHALSLVIDADGLNTLSGMDLSLLKNTACRVVLTPHMKEMERLSGVSMQEIQGDPIGVAEAFAREYGVCLLLKGSCTVVTDGSETILVDRGCAGMATAGSGDVLSGILVGLLGYCEPSSETVACGAYIAGLAGELAERNTNPISMLSSDTVAHIGEAVSMLLKANNK